MNSVRRVVAVATMHARDLSRRRVALTILVLLPVALYLSAELAPADPAVEQLLAENPDERAAAEVWVLTTGGIGPLWSVAVAALFVIMGSRAADHRLLLAGFRPAELLIGRVVTVLGLGAVITPLFTGLIWAMRDVDVWLLAASILLLVVVAVGHGVVIAALVRDEMEGVLAIIGVTGVQMMIIGQAWLPMWGPNELMQRAAGVPGTAAISTAVTHTVIFSAALVAVGVLLWTRRTRLRQPARVFTVDSPAPRARRSA